MCGIVYYRVISRDGGLTHENADMEPNIDGGFSLGTYVLILIRRWWIIAGVFVVCVLGGVGAYLGQPERPFPHTTIIEIGSINGSLVESRESSRAKMDKVYLQRALLEHAQANGYTTNRYNMAIVIPDSTDVIQLETFGTVEDSEDLLGIEARASELLIADHAILSDQQRNNLLSEQYTERLALEKLQGEASILFQQRQDAIASDTLLAQQIVAIEQSIAQFEKQRATLVASEGRRTSREESLAVALLVIDADIEAQRERQQALEQQRAVEQKNLLTSLDRQTLDIEQQQSIAQRRITDIQYMIDGARVTRYLLEPSIRLQESKHGASVYLLLAGLIGVVAGVFAALIVDMVARARRSLRLV